MLARSDVVKLAGNQDRHKISDEIQILAWWGPWDQTSHFAVICPWLLKKAIDDIVQGIVLSFFIGSLWSLQITWAGIKSRKCSNFGQNGLFTLELPVFIAEKTIFDLLSERLVKFQGVQDFDSSPTPGHGPWGQESWNERQPSRVLMVQIWMLSDEWLSRYELL